MDGFNYGDRQRQTWWQRNGRTAIILALLVLLSGALRVAFNYEPATDNNTFRYAGNDDYYHLRVVEKVQESGDHVVYDPLLNYPVPARNPRPPLYDWHVAIFGQILGFFSGEAQPGEAAPMAGQYALEWGSALWGALSVIPIWLIGRAVFSNRAGLWAGFLIAASPAHIQRSGFGLGDHDAFIVFFLLMGAYFLVRALQLTRDDVRVGRWSSFGSVATGFGQYASAHAEGLAYAFLAGVCWAAIGLSWEGYPYVLAVYAVYYVIQLVSNQMRRKDSTGDFLIFSIIAGINIAMCLPNYWITGNIGSTLNSYVYVVAILSILSLALVTTRDLPWLLVLPTMLGVALIGYVLLILVLPDIGALLLSANGYFNQSKLYSTIAEAQRTDLGVFVFSIGFMTFFFALVGFFMAIGRYLKSHDRALLFLVGWAALSIYMGFAATRFVFNAAPIFAILAGWVTVRIVDWMNFKERMRNFQSLRQDSFFKATRSTLGAKQVAGSLFLLLFLIIPNLWFSVDAGIPSEFRDNYRKNHPNSAEFITNRTGAFGQGFLDPNWNVVYGYLNQQDTCWTKEAVCGPDDPDYRPEHLRPGHVAWWDYGFWEVAIAHHPTVADNFQNGHEIAGRILAAQSEKEMFDLMSVRLIEGVWGNHVRALNQSTQDLLNRNNISAERFEAILDNTGSVRRYDDAAKMLADALPDLAASVDFHEQVRATTGYAIDYFLVDNRMLPFDDPSTPYIDSGSILYAPIFLANQNPDDFVQTIYTDTRGGEYTVIAYERGADNVTRQANPIRTVDNSGRCYLVSGGMIFPARPSCAQIDYGHPDGAGVQLRSTSLRFKDAYYNTMFYKGFVGGDKPAFGDYPQEAFIGNGTAGAGLQHFRYVNGTNSVKLLQYFGKGATVTGTAKLASGAPLSGFTVVAQDGRGIDHAESVIGSDGSFRINVPFSLPDEPGIKIAVKQGGSVLVGETIQVTRQDVRAGRTFNVNITIEPASLTGMVYFDKDRDGRFNDTIDDPMEGAYVVVDNRNTTTGNDGRFTFPEVLPGSKNVAAQKEGFSDGRGSASLSPGGNGSVEIAMTVATVAVNGTLKGQDGQPLSNFDVDFAANNATTDYTQDATAITDGTGHFQTSVYPGGSYTVTVTGTTLEDNRTVRYQGSMRLEVSLGSGPITIDSAQLALARTEE